MKGATNKMGEFSVFRHAVKIIVSTKGEFVEQRVNKAIKELEDEGYLIHDVEVNISYAGKEGYQIIACIKYAEEVKNELEDIDLYDIGIDYGAGMSFDGGPSSEA